MPTHEAGQCHGDPNCSQGLPKEHLEDGTLPSPSLTNMLPRSQLFRVAVALALLVLGMTLPCHAATVRHAHRRSQPSTTAVASAAPPTDACTIVHPWSIEDLSVGYVGSDNLDGRAWQPQVLLTPDATRCMMVAFFDSYTLVALSQQMFEILIIRHCSLEELLAFYLYFVYG